MRWLKWALVAAWVGLHAWLWTLLPPVPRWTAEGAAFHSLAFTPDGRSLVTCAPANICVWDVATGHREQTWPRPGPPLTDANYHSMIVMSPTLRRVIVYDIGSDASHLIDLDTGRATALPSFGRFAFGQESDSSVGFLPDGRTVYQLTGSSQGRDLVLRFWEFPDGPERRIPVEGRLFEDLSISSDGQRAVARLHKSVPSPVTVLILDLAAGRIAHELTFNKRVIRAALSPNGQTLAISADMIAGRADEYAPEVELWDAGVGQPIGAVGKGFAPGWNAAGQLVIHDESCMRLIEPPDGREAMCWPIPPHKNDASGATLASKGRRILYQKRTLFQARSGGSSSDCPAVRTVREKHRSSIA